VAVTVIFGLLAVASPMSVGSVLLVSLAVLAGQLSIGWSNDIVDAERDRRVGRTDKPLATGAIRERWVRLACTTSVVTCVVLSLLCGPRAGLMHLGCVAAGWAYNARLKATVLSWVPYAVAFGGLPVFVSLTAQPDVVPPFWLPTAGALLGIGAHLLNALPDFDDDAATGVRGLPHRLGPRWAPVLAVVALVLASVTIAAGADGLDGAVLVSGLVAVAVLAVLSLVASGRTPFRAAVGIALVDVAMLVAR